MLPSLSKKLLCASHCCFPLIFLLFHSSGMPCRRGLQDSPLESEESVRQEKQHKALSSVPFPWCRSFCEDSKASSSGIPVSLQNFQLFQHSSLAVQVGRDQLQHLWMLGNGAEGLCAPVSPQEGHSQQEKQESCSPDLLPERVFPKNTHRKANI